MAHRILIVDDDPTLVEMLTFVLTRGGYQTAAATDGGRAIEILRSTPIDLVVLDVMLPDTDGYEICRRIRALPGIGQLPILMLSARTQVPHVRETIADRDELIGSLGRCAPSGSVEIEHAVDDGSGVGRRVLEHIARGIRGLVEEREHLWVEHRNLRRVPD